MARLWCGMSDRKQSCLRKYLWEEWDALLQHRHEDTLLPQRSRRGPSACRIRCWPWMKPGMKAWNSKLITFTEISTIKVVRYLSVILLPPLTDKSFSMTSTRKHGYYLCSAQKLNSIRKRFYTIASYSTRISFAPFLLVIKSHRK